MKEFLTIGQYAASGSYYFKAGGRREIQPYAKLEMMQEPGARRTSHPVSTAGRLEFLQSLRVIHADVSQVGEIRISRGRGLGEEGGEAEGLNQSKLLEGEMQFRSQVQHVFISYSGKEACSPLERELATAGLNVDVASIADWASVLAIVAPHPGKDHVTGLVGLVASPKIASFIGRLAAVAGETAYVTAVDEATGERFEAECEVSFLRGKGIEKGMEFSCTVTQKRGDTVVEFSPLPPRVLTEEELEQISKEVDARLK